MIQRLLFDGINLQGGRRTVSQAIEFSVLIDADEAESCLTGPDVAMPRAEVAVDFSRRFQLPPAGFVQMFCLLEDLKLFHGSSSQIALYLRTEGTARVNYVCWGNCVRASGVAPALEPLSFRGPIHKPFHVVAVLPGKVKELAGRQIGGFFPEERLKAPANVGTLPRVESITTSCIPVVLHCLEHFLRNGRIRPALFVKTLVFGRRRRKMVVHQHPTGAALFPYPGVSEIHFRSLTVL